MMYIPDSNITMSTGFSQAKLDNLTRWLNMNTDTPDGEWIEWSGGECPVDHSTLVDAKTRRGELVMNCEAGTWVGTDVLYDLWKWEGGQGNNIIAYRLSPSPEHPSSSKAD